jgi:pimeloyl-ACP methyl ester carboxylesterase
MSTASKTATFVLVHGAWGGGWGFTPMANEMRRRGHNVFTPTMTGLGERTHLLDATINLSTHIEDICNVIKYERLKDFVLAGHSYGGMVITGVADRMADRIRSLVYIDAFLPANGKSLFDYTPDANQARLDDAGAKHGGIGMSPPGPFVLPGISAEEAAEIEALRGPQPLATCLEKIKLTGAGDAIKNRMYIFAANNPGGPFRQFYDRVRTQAGWKTAEVNTGHGIHRERPGELITLLESMI